MKSILTTFLSLLFILSIQGQTCLPDGIVFTSQQEIDDFASNYPGCTTINGKLDIEEEVSGDIINLNGLAQIERIEGHFKIQLNEALTNLSGLQNLTYVKSSISISTNASLISISHLEKVESNQNLNVIINNNPVLESLEGINMERLFVLDVKRNNSLNDLTGLENLRYVGFKMKVANEEALTNINALSKLDSVGYGGLEIGRNPLLTSLDGLDGLTFLDGNLNIDYNIGLENLDALSNVTEINGRLTISGTLETNMDAFENLVRLDGFLSLRGNSLLTNIDGLANIDPYSFGSLGNINLYLVDNPLLSTCSIESICYALNQVGFSTDIRGNAAGCNSNIEIMASCEIPNGSCFPSGLHLSSQAEVDDFAAEFDGCNVIEGDLSIGPLAGDTSDIQNLLGLVQITKVNGNLIIEDLTLIETLKGLESIQSIGGSLVINNNLVLNSLDGIQNINPTSMQSTNEDADLVITNNSALSHCEVTSICDLLDLDGIDFEVNANSNTCNSAAEIETACILAAQTCLAGNLIIDEQAMIDNFSADYPTCTNIAGKLTFSGDISSLEGLAQISSIQGDLVIEKTQLTNLKGLENLVFASDITIINNPLINDIDDLSNLETLGNFDLNYNPSLKRVANFSKITSVFGLNIGGNALEDISGFSKLKTAYDINLFATQLEDLTGFASLEHLEASATFNSNTKLESLKGLENLKAIGGYLRMNLNDVLVDLSGLSLLESIDGALDINNNPMLSSTEGLEKLTTINGPLKINSNSSLVTLEGLENISSETIMINGSSDFNITISNNPLLDYCHVASICDFLMLEDTEVHIEDNGTNCMNVAVIEQACLSSLSEVQTQPLIFYPNPVVSDVNIIVEDKDLLIIYGTVSGVISYVNLEVGRNVVDMNHLPSGVYFFKTIKGRQTGSMLKM